MSKATPFITFAIGAVAGAAASWYFAKKKYELIAQEEIKSVKDVFAKRVEAISPESSNDISDAEEKTEMAKDKPGIIEYASKLNDEGYTNYSNVEMWFPDVETKETMGKEMPYIISPDEFGEEDEYETISLTYYADGVLADDMDYLVEDVKETVGNDYASHFGEYEDDSVFVRNDRLKADYEILMDERNYSDVRKTKPYLG